MEVTTLFRDTWWLALDKPAGTVTTPPTTRGAPTLVDLARELAPKALRHHPLSRLDADVTGVVIFALNDEAIELATRERDAGRYHRRYVGVTSPSPETPGGRWAWPVAVDRRDRSKRTAGEGDDPREAETRYQVVESVGSVALVVFAPVTGRTHQIRVHAKAAGCPLAGDAPYGGARRLTMDDGEVVSTPRTLLHAWRVRVPGKTRTIEAPLPAEMRGVWVRCGGRVDALSRWVSRDGEAAFGG